MVDVAAAAAIDAIKDFHMVKWPNFESHFASTAFTIGAVDLFGSKRS